MSLYNMLLGTNPFMRELLFDILKLVGTSPEWRRASTDLQEFFKFHDMEAEGCGNKSLTREQIINLCIKHKFWLLGRLRDACVSPDMKEIWVLTRNGGRNREEFDYVFDILKHHPLFIREADYPYDITYNRIDFRVPEGYEERIKEIVEHTETTDFMERFRRLIDDMAAGKDNAQVRHALDVGKRIFDGMEEAVKTGDSKSIDTEFGSVNIVSLGGEKKDKDNGENAGTGMEGHPEG